MFGVGSLRIRCVQVVSQGSSRGGVGGLGWRRIWESFLEKGAGWWNREEGAVQPRRALRVRVTPIVLGPRKTLLSVMWVSGGTNTP